MRSALLAAVPLLLAACRSAPPEEVIVAHRGTSYLAPENTLAAFELAWELGARTVEGDFFLTRDGHVVCTHDATTERFNDTVLDVGQSTLAELQELDVGSWKDARFADQRPPTLGEVLRTVPEDGTILVEIKCGPEILDGVASAVRESGLRAEQVVLISFDATVVARAKGRLPEHRACWISGFDQDDAGLWRPTAEEVLTTLALTRADGFCGKAVPEVITEELVDRLHSFGYTVNVWTVNDPDLARTMFARGVDSVTTDRPGWLREELR